jgi:hypothetical protein
MFATKTSVRTPAKTVKRATTTPKRLTPAQVRQQKCGSQGVASTDCDGEPIRLFSRYQCEHILRGIWSPNGECADPAGGSFSFDCRNNRTITLTESLIKRHKCGSLGISSEDCDGNPIRKYTQSECEDALGGMYNASGECTKQDGGSYSYDCRHLNEADAEEYVPYVPLPTRRPLGAPLPPKPLFPTNSIPTGSVGEGVLYRSDNPTDARVVMAAPSMVSNTLAGPGAAGISYGEPGIPSLPMSKTSAVMPATDFSVPVNMMLPRPTSGPVPSPSVVGSNTSGYASFFGGYTRRKRAKRSKGRTGTHKKRK